jgi:hypothetical protein
MNISQYCTDLLILYFSIGYPVVTLGYGVKSYVGYKIRRVGKILVSLRFLETVNLYSGNTSLLWEHLPKTPL